MEGKTNNNLEMFIESKLKPYVNEHEVILKNVCGLTPDVLLEDLNEASKYNKGYYKNELGVYMFVKGIEVTNDVSNICRMGLNGEDRGVWIHYCILTDKTVGYYDDYIRSFDAKYFNERYCKKKELMRETTKEDFEEMVKKTINTICSDYTNSIEPTEYHDVIKGFHNLIEDFKNMIL
jgi:hypothetical protein